MRVFLYRKDVFVMNKLKVLFINSEVSPYMPSGRMSDLGRALPLKLFDAGHDVRIFSPRFGTINERRNQLHDVIRLSGKNLAVNQIYHSVMLKVATIMPQRIQVYFIDNDELFSSRKAYSETNGEEYPDQVERCLFFARGVADTVRRLRWSPDVIYCQGWFAAVSSLYLRKAKGESQSFRDAKIVLALFDHAFHTPWPATTSKILKVDGVTKNDIAEIRDRQVDYLSLCKWSEKFCDGVIVSEEGVEQELITNAESLGKTILYDTADELNIQNYIDYFDNLFDNQNKTTEE